MSEACVCVFCPEPLWHVPVSSSRGPVGGGGQRRTARQDVPGKESPNRNSKVRRVVSFFSLLIGQTQARPPLFLCCSG